MHLTREEREVTITFTEADDVAQVYTASLPWIRRLDRIVESVPEAVCLRRGDHDAQYQVPKKLISIRRPPSYTKEQREKMAAEARERLHSS